MKVLSYYSIKDNNERKEYLVEHVKVMIDLLSDFESSRAYEFGELLCRTIGFNFKSSLLQTVVLHDIGKAFYGQSLPKHITEGYLSFPGHETISAVITWNAVEGLAIEQKFSFVSMKPVVFAILYHHHAMDIEKRLQVSERRLRDALNAVKDLREDLEELKDFIPKIFTNELLKVLKNIEKENHQTFIRGIHRKFKWEIERKIWDVLVSNDSNSLVLKKLSLLMLSCLISLDYMADSKIRGQDAGTFFGKAVEDFYGIYCKPFSKNKIK